MVESTLNYLAPIKERPRYYLYPPPEGQSWRNTHGDRRKVAIQDARDLSREPSLDREGFALVAHQTRTTNPFDPDAVRAEYYPEMETLVKQATGAVRVVAFDHNVRSGEIAARGENGVQKPVRFAHNDYTLLSGPRSGSVT